MALLKPLDATGTGHLCEYWRLTGLALDFVTGRATATLSGYRDAAARREGCHPLAVSRAEWTAAELGVGLHDVTAEHVYRAFREAPAGVFGDAADLYEDLDLLDGPALVQAAA